MTSSGKNFLSSPVTRFASLIRVAHTVIRSSGRRTKIVKQDGKVSFVEKAATFPFDTLGFGMQINGGDFLIIGPGVQAARDTSAGHHFLIQRSGGVQSERVLILRPLVVAAEVHRRALPANGFHMPSSEGP